MVYMRSAARFARVGRVCDISGMVDLPALPIEWKISDQPVDYPAALAVMVARVAAIGEDAAPELTWLLEHPPLYTAGTSAQADDLVVPERFPVYPTGRGGQYTYHGPGQRVGYVLQNLGWRDRDVRAHVWRLEEWLIRTLVDLGVAGARREGRVGIWVVMPDGAEKKIAAIGVRVRRWVTFHGVALNVDPDLEHFSGIVPCGLRDYGVTSLAELGKNPGMATVDAALRTEFREVFG